MPQLAEEPSAQRLAIDAAAARRVEKSAQRRHKFVGTQIRHLLDDYSKTIPTVLEMPSKDMPYDPAQDDSMQRVSAMLNTGDGVVAVW